MKFCPNCGKEIAENAKYCINCGTAIESAPQPAAEAPQPQYAQAPQYAQPQQSPQQPQQQQWSQPQNAPIATAPRPYSQPQPYQPYNPGGTPPKKKSRLLVKILIPVAILLILGVCAAIFVPRILLSSAAKADTYKIGDDEIPSLKAALGETYAVTGVSSAAYAGGIKTKTYTYKTDPGEAAGLVAYKYALYLIDKEKFISITDSDYGAETGADAQVARNSVTTGKMLAVDFAWTKNEIVITLMLGDGTVNSKAQSASISDPQLTVNTPEFTPNATPDLPAQPTPIAPTPIAPTPVPPTPIAPTPIPPTPTAPQGNTISFDNLPGFMKTIASGRYTYAYSMNLEGFEVTGVISADPGRMSSLTCLGDYYAARTISMYGNSYYVDDINYTYSVTYGVTYDDTTVIPEDFEIYSQGSEVVDGVRLDYIELGEDGISYDLRVYIQNGDVVCLAPTDLSFVMYITDYMADSLPDMFEITREYTLVEY